VNIIFVEPGFPANQRRFALALAAVGANVVGIGESEEWMLDDELRAALASARMAWTIATQSFAPCAAPRTKLWSILILEKCARLR
jgi:hypothetical protein